jgi:hypothetical protein
MRSGFTPERSMTKHNTVAKDGYDVAAGPGFSNEDAFGRPSENVIDDDVAGFVNSRRGLRTSEGGIPMPTENAACLPGEYLAGITADAGTVDGDAGEHDPVVIGQVMPHPTAELGGDGEGHGSPPTQKDCRR